MTIPKRIHYVWVGPRPLPPRARQCIASWRRHLPKYELVLWNERNSPMDRPYVREMYRRRRWAFVADYIRFWALDMHGGIYLDTDMEVLKPLDRFRADRIFFGRASSDGFISCGIIGATAGHPFIKSVLEEYDRQTDFVARVTSPQTVTMVYENYPDKDSVRVYGPEYFYPCNAGERCTAERLEHAYTTHHWEESWVAFRGPRRLLRRIGVLPIAKTVLFRCVKFGIKMLSGTGIGNVPGVLPLYRWFYRFSNPGGIAYIHCQGRKMFVNTEDTGVAPDLLATGGYGPFETELLQRLLTAGMTAVNIGANIGYYTLIAAEKVGPRGRVYAFEPEPRNYRLLLRNIAANGYTNVRPIRAAVSNSQGTLQLFLDRSNLGSHSLAQGNTDGNGGVVEVATDSLDHYLEADGTTDKVDVILMDVQGAEGTILEGAKKILAASRVTILMEFWPHGLERMGTDPLALLRGLQDNYGFAIGLLDERNRCIRYPLPEQILETCRQSRRGRGSVNLLLQHRQDDFASAEMPASR